MGEIAGRRFDTVVASEIGLAKQIAIHLERQMVGQLFALRHGARESHHEAARFVADDRAFEAPEIVEIDDGAALGLLLQLAHHRRVARRNIFDGANRFFLRGRDVEPAGDGHPHAAETPALLEGAGDDLLAWVLGPVIGGAHARIR